MPIRLTIAFSEGGYWSSLLEDNAAAAFEIRARFARTGRPTSRCRIVPSQRGAVKIAQKALSNLLELGFPVYLKNRILAASAFFASLGALFRRVVFMQVARNSIGSAPVLRRYRKRPKPQPANIPVVNTVCDSVYLVEGNPSVRAEVSACLSLLQLKVIAFASARECLLSLDSDTPACVVLNIQLPDGCGLKLQEQLAAKSNPPVIVIADQCDITSMISAMKAGAMDLLTTPLNLAALAESVRVAFERGRKQWQRKAALTKLRERLTLLTPRECEVIPLIVGGLLNKQAASLLGISEVTFQIHRSQVMRKMQARSVAELVRMAIELRIPYRRLSEE